MPVDFQRIAQICKVDSIDVLKPKAALLADQLMVFAGEHWQWKHSVATLVEYPG